MFINFVFVLILLLYIFKIKESFKINKFSIIKDDINEDITSQSDILNDEWLEYRLGDVIKGYFKDNNNVNPQNNEKYLNEINIKFKNSIASEYIKITKGHKDINILYKIIEDRSKYLKTKKETCLHLRLGDVLIDSNNPNKLPDKWSNKVSYNYPYEMYNKVASYLKHFYQLNEITIIGGAHRNFNLSESLKYFNEVKNIFKRHNFIVNIRLGNNPDVDFLIMCNSNIFVKASGGFSKEISNYVKYKGKIVIEPDKL
jgi:Ni,Fe-hydrogenase III component G